MGFSPKNLNPNETIAVDLHPHWWYFAAPAASLVAAIVVGILIVVNDVGGTGGDVLKVLTVAALVVSALWLASRYVRWVNTHFVITSHRIIFRSGVLAKSGIEIPLERVNNVNFNQTVFERVVGAGDLLIESGGEDGQSRFSDIRHPDQVQRMIHAQVDAAVMRRHGRGRGQGYDVAEQLERLEGLLQRGALTPDEFESQKRRLLG
jgi:uncharacterized membrane protein YdbT with pleckstrin-like domain